MFVYKQSIESIFINYKNCVLGYRSNSNSGERIENNGLIKISNCSSLLKNDKSPKLPDKSKLTELKNFLDTTHNKLIENGVNFSCNLCFHNEKVNINDLSDDRSFNSFRLILEKGKLFQLGDIDISGVSIENIKNEITDFLDHNTEFIKLKGNFLKSCKWEKIPVVLSSQAAGFWVHEILGHIFEEDFYSYYKDIINNAAFSKKLNIVDSVEESKKLFGMNKYDDLGTEIKAVEILKDGKINNILALKSENSFDKTLYGVARRQSYEHDVLPRMRCTCVLPFDDISLEQILKKYPKCIFINQAYTGKFIPQENKYEVCGSGFLISECKKQEFISDLKFTGDIKESFKLFDYIGNDFKLYGGYCSKFGQDVRVGIGSPSVSITGACVEGDIYG